MIRAQILRKSYKINKTIKKKVLKLKLWVQYMSMLFYKRIYYFHSSVLITIWKTKDEIISLDLNINQGSKWLFFFFLKWTYWMMKNTYSTSIVLLISFSLSLIFIGFFSLDFFNCVEFSFLDFCDPFSWKKLSLFISKCRKLNFEF